MPEVFSIGHSNQSIEAFLALLQRAGIETLADVRTMPASRFSPQFNRARLTRSLADAGIEYVFLGEELGGRPRAPELYDGEGHVLYGRIAETPAFQAGLGRLPDLIAERRTAVMCAEEDPAGCHRTLLVGRCLDAAGISMLNIRRSGAVEPERDYARPAQAPLALPDPSTWRSVRPLRLPGS